VGKNRRPLESRGCSRFDDSEKALERAVHGELLPYIFVAYVLSGIVLVSIRSPSAAIRKWLAIRKVLEETAIAPELSMDSLPLVAEEPFRLSAASAG
jgi:hypothetical protein